MLKAQVSLGGGTPLDNLVTFSPSKAELHDLDDAMIVSFIEMASVSNYGYIETMVQRPLGKVRSGSYTYFAENDIIIAKITPCMENGKCAVATGLSNGIAFGSSEFHVLRCKKGILSKYVFGFLNREKVRQAAARQMTGSSGHRRVPVSFYETMRIPVLSTIEQESIVSKVETLEAKIADAERALKEIEARRVNIIRKHLSRY